jgi:2-polyprenyl-3-methyl-5-hydroxy-6-metoxy-1,4-benzoquinol methylase
MLAQHASSFVHPVHRTPLELRPTHTDGAEILEGELIGERDRFPIVRGIPRFCPADNYAESFGYQWQKFSQTQLDSKTSWASRSEIRLYEETGWSRDLEGQRILEAGSGMGRFTEHLARTGAEVLTFDYSTAVDANRANNGHYSNVSFAQGDIYSPPYAPASFDKVLCLGVIQHCPSPRGAFESLVRFLKPGGEIVIDVYRLFWKSLFMGKYYLRPVTRLLPTRAQHAFVKAHMAWSYPLTSAIHQTAGLRAGRYASMLLSLADFRGLPDFDDELAREMSELDTLDMLAPRYDRPQTLGMVHRWLEEAGLTNIRVRPGYNGVEARGRRPA